MGCCASGRHTVGVSKLRKYPEVTEFTTALSLEAALLNNPKYLIVVCVVAEWIGPWKEIEPVINSLAKISKKV